MSDKPRGTNLKDLDYNEIGRVAETPNKEMAMLLIEKAMNTKEYVVVESPKANDKGVWKIQLHKRREDGDE